jgi:hypothetical protein
MVEVQAHGFTFEKWVRDTFFDGYSGSYMQKWDIPPDANTHPSVPIAFRGIPVSIKTAKLGSPIGLGDVLRQRQIDAGFLMIAGFWRQRTTTEKWIEEIGVVHFPGVKWVELWGQLSIDHLREIDAVIKDMDHHYSIARQRAKSWKASLAEVLSAKLVINPKIDSKSQRRIQCSLPFEVFWAATGRNPQPTDHPKLFGVQFPNPISSSARKFNV